MASSPIRQAFEKILTDKKNHGLPPLGAEDYDHFLGKLLCHLHLFELI
jgi:hypothetical protein